MELRWLDERQGTWCWQGKVDVSGRGQEGSRSTQSSRWRGGPVERAFPHFVSKGILSTWGACMRRAIDTVGDVGEGSMCSLWGWCWGAGPRAGARVGVGVGVGTGFGAWERWGGRGHACSRTAGFVAGWVTLRSNGVVVGPLLRVTDLHLFAVGSNAILQWQRPILEDSWEIHDNLQV